MLDLTTRAEEHLLELRAAGGFGESHAARFIANGSALGVTFAPAPTGDDCVVDGAALPIFISVEAAELIDGGVIDAASRDGRLTLVLRHRARATGTVVVRGMVGP